MLRRMLVRLERSQGRRLDDGEAAGLCSCMQGGRGGELSNVFCTDSRVTSFLRQLSRGVDFVEANAERAW